MWLTNHSFFQSFDWSILFMILILEFVKNKIFFPISNE